jgi:hypothetical protein
MLNLPAITSFAVVRQTDPGDITVLGDIDSNSVVYLTSTGGNIHIEGKIDGTSFVYLQATLGNVTIDGKIDGGSTVTLKAGQNVTIGTTGGDGNEKIDGNSTVTIIAGANIIFGSYIHKATVNMTAHGTITLPDEIDYSGTVQAIADGNISLSFIHGSSSVSLVSNRGTITLTQDVDGSSGVTLTAAGNIGIGTLSGNQNIQGNSFVSATSGGTISLGGQIDGSNTVVDFLACKSINIGQGISGGASVRLLTGAGGGSITLGDPITDSGTNVISFPVGAIVPAPIIQNSATFTQSAWAATDTECLATPKSGTWWENWSQTFGYVVAPATIVPHTLAELVAAVAGAGREDETPVKAVGGGWSFTDASLPMQDAASVDQASIMLKGRSGQQDMQNLLQYLSNRAADPMDLLPGAVTNNATFSTAYDQTTMRQITAGGAQLPTPAKPVRLIDTRALCSSLQCLLPGIRAPLNDPARGPVPGADEILFWVEAGITIADLQQLLDHQFPRLAFRATGGSPGATLAGTLSTATHGGEFAWPLLVDSVRAIHLVGPGGEEWWIEGDIPVADPVKLEKRYPAITPAHFIGGAWSTPPLPGLTPQDVLNAVTVSMGTMGVIYSVVFEVVPQFGIRQITTSTEWSTIQQMAGVTTAQLQAGDAAANVKILNFLMDGTANGTGIPKADNVYIDLAINPFNQDCWIINRSVTPSLPDDSNNFMAANPITTLGIMMSQQDNFSNNQLIARIFDFFDWQTNPIGFATNNIGEATALINYILTQPNPLVAAVAVSCVQVQGNIVNQSGQPTRGMQFFGDLLSGFFHTMQGTLPGINADATDIAYKVGAIGWPNSGVPGRGLEIALDQTNAFTFLQNVLFDNILLKTMLKNNKPLVGYISIRVCPQTTTLLGMQQYGPHSIMLEVVGYRSPEANTVMDQIQQSALSFTGPGPRPLLHWGLENALMDAAHLALTPLGQPYKAGFTRLSAFSAIRQFLRQSHPPVFDNAFSKRMGL